MQLLKRHERAKLRVWSSLFVLGLAFQMTWMGLPFQQGMVYGQDDKVADEGAAKPAPAEGGATESSGGAQQTSMLTWFITASGPFGACIAIESFVLVALISMNFMNFRRENFIPAALIEGFEQKVQAKDYQGAYELAKGSDSYLGKILTAGMANLSKGYDEAAAAMQESGDDEALALEHKLSYIGLIVATAPMLGLLGTVSGMIGAFKTIADSETSPKPKELAVGIMTALITTLEGLTVAIPAIFAFGLFKNRVSRLQFEVGVAAEGLMKRFSTVKKPAAAAPASGATA